MATDQNWRLNRAHLRDQLEARRGQLMEDMQRLRARIREHGSTPTRTDLEADVDEGDLDASLIDITNTTLRRIDVALERLGSGWYGRCTRCRGAIAESRLVAMPFAVCCRRCEGVRERESRLPCPTVRSRPWPESTA